MDNTIYSRERLAGYDPAILNNATALVVGVGALGQNTVLNLALSGFGEIRIVDKDVFEEHNRTRSPFFAAGRKKAEAVAERLRSLMSAPSPVVRFADAWIEELGDGAFNGVSVVVSCVDSVRARAYLTERASYFGIPLVEGGFAGSRITLTVIPARPTETPASIPCWRCFNEEIEGAFSCRFYAARAEEAGFIPAIQPAAATLAGLQAEAAILAAHGVATDATYLTMDIREGRCHRARLLADPVCSVRHRRIATAPERLATTGSDSIERLLDEVGDRLGGPATLFLPSQLVWSAPCAGCGESARVRAPEWVWVTSPHCDACGGPFPRNGGAATTSAELYPELSRTSCEAPMSSTCHEVGLPSLALVEGYTDDGASGLFELAGSIDDLFQLPPA